MQIHKVKRGETVFHIARKHNTSPVKIIENNGLVRADALSVGDELLILMPTRSYTVRGGETLAEISERFGVKVREIIKNNPSLGEDERLRPSMTLALRYAPPKYGTAANLGYIRAETTRASVRQSLPYLSYYVLDCASSDGADVRLDWLDEEMLDAILYEKKMPLVRVRSQDVKEDFYKNRRVRENFMDKLISLAKENRFRGIVLSCDLMGLSTRGERDAFLLELRKRLIGSDLILFCETDTKSEFGDYADANILLPSYLMAEDGYSRVHKVNHAAKIYEAQKTFLGFPTYALDGERKISYERMREIAYKGKTEFKHEDGMLVLHYPHFVGGKRESRLVRCLSLSGKEELISLVSDYGFMGCALEVEYFNAPSRLLLSLAFSGIDYAFTII